MISIIGDYSPRAPDARIPPAGAVAEQFVIFFRLIPYDGLTISLK